MNKIIDHPVFLLLITGTLLGFNFPLGKLAGQAAVSPIVWALVISLGAFVVLLPILAVSGRISLPRKHMLTYVSVSAAISFVIPNILVLSVMKYVGAGYMGLMFALSPVFTLSLALLFKMKTPGRLGMIGIVVGLLGAVVISVTRGLSADAPDLIWILLALMVPASLACGNIYRTLAWPEGASADNLAFWSQALSVLFFLMILFLREEGAALKTIVDIPAVTFVQLIVAGMTFPVLFRLQKTGGPVILSQIGYVAAAVGLAAATIFMGEVYSQMTWFGASVIAVGICLSIMAQLNLSGGQKKPA